MKTQAKLRPVYDEAEVERGLLALAEASGNAEQAAKWLADDGLPIDARTLRRWKRKSHAARYEQVRSEVLPQLRAKAADKHSALADRQLEVSEAMTERLAREVEGIPVRDLPGGVRNVVVSAAVNRDKSQVLNDAPTTIVGRRSFDEIKRLLKQKGIVIDGTAVEDDGLAALPPATDEDADAA